MIPNLLFSSAPILLDLAAESESHILQVLIDSQSTHPHLLDSEAFLSAVLARQKIQTPLLSNGIAIPHARTDSVTELILLIARCNPSIPFGPLQSPVHLIFLFGIPSSQSTEYLNALATLTKTLRNPQTLKTLQTASTPTDFRNALLSPNR